MDAMDKELQEVSKKIREVKRAFLEKEYQQILASGADVARIAMISEAPKGKAPIHVMKDFGGTTKTVKSGNLQKSIQVFSFKGSFAVFVGVVVSRWSKLKKIKGYPLTRARRAFYWRFVYYGAYSESPNRFIDRARDKSKKQVITKLKAETLKYLPKRLKKIFDK